jgi:hypothetical protein
MRLQLNKLMSTRLPLLPGGKLKVAQLSPGTTFQSAEVFAPGHWQELEAFAPNVLVGSAADLQRLAERIDLRTLNIDSVDHAIFVVTEIGDKPLTDLLRVVLWQRFGVPVYELLTRAGMLLGFECENHDGLHILGSARFLVQKGELMLENGADRLLRTGMLRELDSVPCPCGRPGARIMEPRTGHVELPTHFEEPVLAAIA